MEKHLELKEVVLSIGNTQITGKECLVKSLVINQTNNIDTVYGRNGKEHIVMKAPEPVEITIELVCNPKSFFYEFWDDDYKPKIRNKRVEDCSVQELLFAIRSKLK